MARTIEAIMTELRTLYPERTVVRKIFDGGEVFREELAYTAGDPEYDYWIAESAEAIRQTEIAAETESTRRALRTQVRTALTQLAAGRSKLAVTNADRQAFANLPLYPAATQAQKAEILRICTDELLQDVIGLVNVLIDREVIERNGA
jgi:hypothetical protein